MAEYHPQELDKKWQAHWAATQAFEAGLGGLSGEGWRWLGLLVVFAALYTGLGIAVFGLLLEDA